jgi:peptidoglycan/LPS O-acetylase OafA/YrhL
VRAFAALWVVLHHLRTGPSRDLVLPALVDDWLRHGYLGVDLFGFLSGFVITHNYAERLARHDLSRTARYLWVRAVRIVPLHWLTLAALVLAHATIEGFGTRSDRDLYGRVDLAQSVLLVHGWGVARGLSWNVPSWTVSSEWLCYLLFPLLAPRLARARDGARCALGAAACTVATLGLMHAVGRPDFQATHDWGFARIAGEFAAGCLLQRAWAAGLGRTAPWGAIAPAAAGFALACIPLRAPGATVAAFGVLVYALAHERGALARLCATRAALFAGEASYALYMVHWVVIRVLAYTWLDPRPGAGGPEGVWRLLGYLGAIGATTLAAHLAFEAPARRRLRRWFAPP